MSDIPGNTSTTATIGVGQVINGTLTFGGDADWYKAAFSAGLDYGFRLSGDGSGSSLPDPDLSLYDASGNRIAGGTNFSNTSITLNFSALNGGTYFVGVGDTADLGNYILTWLGSDTIRRDINTTSTLSQGQTVNSAVDVAGDADWFKVSLTAGLDYGFVVSGDGSGTSLPDADMHLRDANGNKLIDGTNFSNSSYSIAYAAGQTGFYFIDIGDTSESGNYKLSWVGADTILRNTSTTATLATGKTLTSAIDVKGDSDWFKVVLKAGISYAFTVSGTGTPRLSDGDIHLRDANGNKLVDGTNYSSSTGLITFTAQTAGTYFLDVTDPTNIGRYIVANPSLDTVVNNAGTKQSLLTGRTASGNIDVQGDSDWYAITVKAGVTYRFEAGGSGTPSAGGLRLVLRDANGKLIDSDADSTAIIEFTATTSGRMYLDVAGISSSTKGKFILSAISNEPVLKGTTLNDVLTGGDNNTTIYGYAGNDRLVGAGGNDVLVGGTGADTLVGGVGTDTASYAGATRGVSASLTTPATNTGDAKGDVYSSIESLTGSSFADKLQGNSAANRLSGGAGNDTLEGAAGNDTLVGDTGTDTLYGGAGADRLYGGAGADTFRFVSYKDSIATAQDIIYDFARSQGDKINLSAIDARTSTAANDAFTFIGEKAFGKKAGELRYENKGGDTYLYGDVNGDGKIDLSIRFDATIDFLKADFIL